jgi:serine phosphatase RsbU (regulator of sigma subunit)
MTTLGESDLAKLMEQLNELVYESSAAHRYATFFFAVYDRALRRLSYVNAGHNPLSCCEMPQAAQPGVSV